MGRGDRGSQAVSQGLRMSGPRGRQISDQAKASQDRRTVAASEALEVNYTDEQAFDQAVDMLVSWRRPFAAPDKPETPSAAYDRKAVE